MHRNELKQLIKECVLEVLKESLSEGFDPQSQGPNVIDPSRDNNPYPALNAKMRTLEEEEDDVSSNNFVLFSIDTNTIELEINASTIERAYEKVEEMFGDMAEYHGDYDLTNYKITKKDPNQWTIVNDGTGGTYILFNKSAASYPITNENEHGREAQTAGAGQFDPRTFGPENVTCEKCNHSFDYNSVSEVQMGSVRCPKCKTKVDQTGQSFGVK